MLFILLLIFVSGCTAKQPGISEDATIIHKTYGAFTLPEMQIQELTVNNTAIVFTTSDNEGNFMKKYEKPFNQTAFKDLITLFEKNKFLEMNDSYTPQEGQPIVTDVGTLEISLIEGNKSKTVKVDPYYSEYMPEGLRKIDSKLLELRVYTLSFPPKEAEMIARTWIENSPTYSFDGFDLKLENHEILETIPEQHFLTYTFMSRHGGYGNRTGQMTTQVLTPHKIEIIVSEKNITSAVIDGEWDELSQQPVPKELDTNNTNYTNDTITTGANAEGEFVKIKYKITEEKAPWDKWYEEGNIKFIKAPTPTELIFAYYGTVHNIELYEVNKTEDCDQSCSCNESYYVAKVKTNDFEKMKTLGWTDLQES
jgi:hypothetical protein